MLVHDRSSPEMPRTDYCSFGRLFTSQYEVAGLELGFVYVRKLDVGPTKLHGTGSGQVELLQPPEETAETPERFRDTAR